MPSSPRAPSASDRALGAAIRRERWRAGVTQEQLGEAIGVAFQQVQKYEIGSNRITALALWRVAKFLDVPLEEFLPSPESGTRAALTRDALRIAEAADRLPAPLKFALMAIVERMVRNGE